MPILLKQEEGGKLLVAHVNGKLTTGDYERFVSEFERLLRQHGKPCVLFDITDFEGWEAGAMWEEIKFDIRHFADIERLAVVGDKQWQHVLTTFFRPFTKATIRYFDHDIAVAEVRKWLDEG